MISVVSKDALWSPLSELEDLDLVFENLKRQGVLELNQLHSLLRWLLAIEAWVHLPREEVKPGNFQKDLETLPDPRQWIQKISGVLEEDGTMSELASPLLSQLHHEVRSLKRQIDQRMNEIMNRFLQSGILQERYTDVREGRYVLPVKVGEQSKVRGRVVEASVSRQTVFIEPEEVEDLNNQMNRKNLEIQAEIYRVLSEVSQFFHPFCPEIESAVEVLVRWDVIQSKARVGRTYGGKPVFVTADRELSLDESAHPLLWEVMDSHEIIKNSITLSDPHRVFLISGPNTGGKTVLLKLLGLAAIFARTGCLLPAKKEATIPFFDSIFVDLGDYQSIEEHVSSFSGHLLRFRNILKEVTGDSLVLFDELNTATDPEEGAALSRAILETLIERSGAMIVATTHDPRLKSWGYVDERILSGSMEFNEEALSPTYNLQTGFPGRSRAIETAEKLGLDRLVLDRAREFLSADHQGFEETIARLEKETRAAVQDREAAKRVRDEAENLKKEWLAKTRQKTREILEDVQSSLRKITQEARDQTKKIVRGARKTESVQSELRDLHKKTEEVVQRELKAGLEAHLDAETAAAVGGPELEFENPATPPIRVGSTVRIPRWKNSGEVLEIKGEKARVAAGKMTAQFSLDELEWQADPLPPKPAQDAIEIESNEVETVESQLDLRGFRFEEAMKELEIYLDRAFRSQKGKVLIIHGVGTGALREGTKGLLSKLPYVKEHRDGGPSEGGVGVTVVEF